MYNIIYISKIYILHLLKIVKHISWWKQNHFKIKGFKTKDLDSLAKRRLLGLLSKNIFKLLIPDTRP